MKTPMEYKSALTRIEDVDEKGIVVFYPAVMNVKDLGSDTIKSGAFTKTIQENFANIQHYKNHNDNILIGALNELKEQGNYLRGVSKLMLKTFDGVNAYEQYKAMAEAGKTMKHSIGYATIKQLPDPEGGRFLKEIALYEVSTLTKFPMNPMAGTESVKSLENLDLNELLKEEKYFQLLLNCKFTDAKLAELEQFKNHIASLIESRSEKNTPEKPIVITGSEAIKLINFKL
jgi:HK97 family phage prohead protease